MAYYVKSIFSLEISHTYGRWVENWQEGRRRSEEMRRVGSMGNLIKGLALLSPLPDFLTVFIYQTADL